MIKTAWEKPARRARKLFAAAVTKIKHQRTARADRAQVERYALNPDRARAWAHLLATLELAFPPDALLQKLKPHLVIDDLANLNALLDFIARAPTPHAARGAVIRAADLPARAGAPPRRRNILFITGELPNPLHGGGARVSDFLKLIARDHAVFLSTNYFSADDLAMCADQLAAHCVKTQNIFYPDFENHPEKIRRFIGADSMDIAHYEWPRALTNYARDLARFHIFTFMEVVGLRLWIDLARVPPSSPAWNIKLIALLNALKVELVDAARVDLRIVVTQKDGEFLARLNPNERYFVVNHGVTLADFDLPERAPEPHTLLFIGNYLHYPNEDAVKFFFEQIAEKIRAAIPDWRIYLVGAHPTRAVQAYQDQRHVFVTGAVADLRPYIQRAAVCIAPLITGAGMRSKVAQYAALKRPCVATHIATQDLVFENGKEIFIADDPARFAECVIRLLTQPDLARQMGQAAFTQTQKFYDNARFVEQLNRLYDYLENPDHVV